MITSKSFFSKILLFGEYSVIRNSMALSIPYPLFEGKLTFRKDQSMNIDSELRAFSQYLHKLIQEQKNIFQFDISSFEFDLAQGLYFDSTIPQGFGAGSSGALVAAIFDRYGQEEVSLLDIRKLKQIFSQMESHFHGSSSGVDPLISYLNNPILIKNKNELGPVYLPKLNKGPGAIFLLNTRRSRKTEPLVNLFLEKCSNQHFADLCDHKLIPITNSCINNFLEGNLIELEKNFKALSHFQFEHFLPMIPKLFQDLWKKGLDSDQYYLKLCGAGGGGFLMGITRDFSKTRNLLDQYEIRPLMQFEI